MDAFVLWRLAFNLDVSEETHVDHADVSETSLMMYYQKEVYGREDFVDISLLPGRGVPLR